MTAHSQHHASFGCLLLAVPVAPIQACVQGSDPQFLDRLDFTRSPNPRAIIKWQLVRTLLQSRVGKQSHQQMLRGIESLVGVSAVVFTVLLFFLGLRTMGVLDFR